MQKLTKWVVTDCGCGVYRALEGTDGNEIANRVAFIEKTPRVRIREYRLGEDRGTYEDGGEYIERRWPEFLDWYCGPKGSGPNDSESRAWCDRMLIAMGYKLEN